MASSNSAPLFRFSILPATVLDIPRLAEIHVIALADDPTARLKFDTETEFLSSVVEMLESQMSDPTWHLVKAVNTDSEIIAAWASWQTHKGTAPSTTLDSLQHKDEVNSISFTSGLGQHVRQAKSRIFDTWRAKHAPCSYLSLRACFTDLAFRRRGLGSALVRYGAERANRMSLATLVQATPMGKDIYEKAGFEVFDVLDVELKDWGEGEEGVYQFWYMAKGGFGTVEGLKQGKVASMHSITTP